MEEEQTLWFAELYFDARGYTGDQLYEDVMLRRIASAEAATRALEAYKKLNTDDDPYLVRPEDLWQWYALSRVNDLMLLSFQSEPGYYRAPQSPNHSTFPDFYSKDDGPNPPLVSPEQYIDFFNTLGFRVYERDKYSPFYFEIVEAVETEHLPEPVIVERVFWPGLMFGQMLFSRAAARVLFRPGVLNKQLAETSTLDWTWWRKYRSTTDGSAGWGHNSQWRTDFRRDYATNDGFYFNVDSSFALHAPDADDPSGILFKQDPDLTIKDRIEYLTNRCFVSTDKHGPVWPYMYTYRTQHLQGG